MVSPELSERVAELRARIAAAIVRGGHRQNVTIVAVTKTHPADVARAAWNAGITDLGENKVQEALGKMPQVDVPVRWHLIGHLQRNKVKSLDRFVLFHALDSSRLADAVDRFGAARGAAVDALLQVNAAGEEKKGGFEPAEVSAEAARLTTMRGVSVRGAMSMARLGADERELRSTFAATREMRRVLQDAGHPANELSMGMSEDFEIAVEEGATIVRIGSLLFGRRSQ